MNLRYRWKWRYLSLSVGLVMIASFISCLNVKMELHIKKDGKIDVILEYQFKQDDAQFGRGFGADNPWPLPLTEKDFKLQTIRHEGVWLKRYRSRLLSDGSEIILVHLQAESIDALGSALGWDMRLNGKIDSGSLEIDMPVINPVLNDSSRMLLESVVAESDFTLRVKTPRRPRKMTEGVIKGNSGVFSVSLKDIVFSSEPKTWAITW